MPHVDPHDPIRPARVASRAGAALAASIMLVVVGASSASATTFADVTIEDLARASDLVLVGRVEHVEVHATGPAGQPGIHTRAVVQVAQTLRGEHEPFVEVWLHGGRLGDRMRIVPGQARLRAGDDVALFLFRAGGGLWPTGMGRGRWHVESGRSTVVAPAGAVASRPTVSIAELARRVRSAR